MNVLEVLEIVQNAIRISTSQQTVVQLRYSTLLERVLESLSDSYNPNNIMPKTNFSGYKDQRFDGDRKSPQNVWRIELILG